MLKKQAPPRAPLVDLRIDRGAAARAQRAADEAFRAAGRPPAAPKIVCVCCGASALAGAVLHKVKEEWRCETHKGK
jgi:hypothetical protein